MAQGNLPLSNLSEWPVASGTLFTQLKLASGALEAVKIPEASLAHQLRKQAPHSAAHLPGTQVVRTMARSLLFARRCGASLDAVDW